MIAKLTFKTPDVLDQLPECECHEDDGDFECNCGIKNLKELVKKYVQWDEYINIEFDSTTQEVKVLKC